MKSINGVEIFKTGTHNGDKYDENDLDEMVRAHGELDFRPAIKVGHVKDFPGAPAYGWVTNLRRVGQKLVADFTDMHDSVIEAIRKRSYSRVSSEVYFNLKRGGKTFRRALKAVALLGAEVPAVAGLVPLHKMEFAAADEYEGVFVFEEPLDTSNFDLASEIADRLQGSPNFNGPNPATWRSPGDELDLKAKAYLRAHPGLAGGYIAAIALILQNDAELRRAYLGDTKDYAEDSHVAHDDAGVILDRAVRAYRYDHPEVNYVTALEAVASAEPALYAAYQEKTA